MRIRWLVRAAENMSYPGNMRGWYKVVQVQGLVLKGLNTLTNDIISTIDYLRTKYI